MPAKKKNPAMRQDNRPQRAGLAIVATNSDVEIPPFPRSIDKPLVATKARWVEFWENKSAQAATEDVDSVLVERWIIAYDEWIRATKAVRRARMVKGSTGQPALNPLAAYAKSMADEMRKAEASLGIGPKERAALGIEFGRAQLTAADLNKMTEESDEHDDSVIDVDSEEAELLAEFE